MNSQTILDNKKPIVLVGYMGSGKSTVAMHLAKKMGYKKIDLDDFIEENAQSSIQDIFSKLGEMAFRKIEKQALENLLKKEKIVLAVGGGTPCYYDNMQQLLSGSAAVVYLNTPVAILVDRLWHQKDHRPLIAHISNRNDLTEFVAKHLFERRQFYTQASLSVGVEQQSPEALAEEIYSLLS